MDRDPGIAALPHHDRAGWYIRGLLMLRDGAPADAAALLTEAMRCDPGHPGIRRNLVRAWLAAKDFAQALVTADAALEASPDEAELHFARGTALSELGQPGAARAAFAEALRRQPDHAACWLNLGNAAADLDDLAAADAAYREALRLDPAMPEAHASVGFLLTMQGRLEAAIEACDAAIGLAPDFAQAHWNRAIALLLGGDLARGFAAYEWRRRHDAFRDGLRDLPGPRWDGGSLEGRRILVRAEQGFGDTIQFARYLPKLISAGGQPILACAPPVMRLIEDMYAAVEVVAAGDEMPGYDTWIDQMSLPAMFGTTLGSIPDAAGYLRADPERVAAWRRRLPDGRKVGLVLAGNPGHRNDHRRSVPLDVAIPLLATPLMATSLLAAPALAAPALHFINLQHGRSARSLDLADLSPWLTDYAETAALVANLDLVVTVDTSVAHLAGALGKPAWVMLPFAPDWRWLLHRTDSPWYRSVRLFRQPAAGDWTSVLRQVTEELAGWATPQLGASV